MTAESWRPVPGYEGSYEVSDLGRVRSLDRITSHGQRLPGRALRGSRKQSGHLQVGLWSGGAGGRRMLVHRLVLLAFVGPPPPGAEGCHNNGDPSNNALENLRWDTRSANRVDTVRHGSDHNSTKTQCPQGHLYDEANTYYKPSRPNRQCRQCKRQWSQKYRQKEVKS